MAPGISFVNLVLVASVAAHVPDVLEGWGDHTGASSSEGDVITCVVGVLCRCGFGRGPEEICESGFECTPAQSAEPEPAVVGSPPRPAEVPGVPKPPLAPPGPEAPGPGPTPKPAMSPESNGSVSDVSAHEVSSIANGTMVHHVPGNISSGKPHMSNGTMPINASALSNASTTSTSPQLRGSAGKSAGKAAGTADQPEGPRRHSKSHKVKCHCGVGCKWGHHMEGKKRICHGPLHCEPCMQRHTGQGFCGPA